MHPIVLAGTGTAAPGVSVPWAAISAVVGLAAILITGGGLLINLGKLRKSSEDTATTMCELRDEVIGTAQRPGMGERLRGVESHVSGLEGRVERVEDRLEQVRTQQREMHAANHEARLTGDYISGAGLQALAAAIVKARLEDEDSR